MLTVVALAGCTSSNGRNGPGPLLATFAADVVPAPAQAAPAAGVTFTIPAHATIVTTAGSTEAAHVGSYLADLLGGAATREGTAPVSGGVALLLDPTVGTGEQYQLEVTADGVTIRAGTGAGLFWGVQTLRQLMPAQTKAPVVVPGGRIVDAPRFAYRGVMLDVARHFFDVATVERLIDLAAMYKVNYLHLHLTDDQGWRIAVGGWPRLTEEGAATEVGGGKGGYYTADDYRQIVAYAADRYMTVVPEIDVPGHTNAALASYAELTCNGVAPAPYTGINVGFSALCASSDAVGRLLDDTLGELAQLTPGPYLHIGGDEANAMAAADYATIVDRAQQIVARDGKTAVGWQSVAADAAPSTVLQFYEDDPDVPKLVAAATAGTKVIMSPANHAYLDQKYDPTTRIGLSWAGPTSVEQSYAWDPANYLPGLRQGAVLGVEAPLWTETVTTVDDIDYLMFPRLAAIAEIGWSPESTHNWAAFRGRLGAQAPRWTALGVDFARADGVPWVAA
jgi:hexosaminidase